jgi:hypothetical protein
MHTCPKAVKRHISRKYALPRGVIFAATVRGSAHWPVAVTHAQRRQYGDEAAIVP